MTVARQPGCPKSPGSSPRTRREQIVVIAWSVPPLCIIGMRDGRHSALPGGGSYPLSADHVKVGYFASFLATVSRRTGSTSCKRNVVIAFVFISTTWMRWLFVSATYILPPEMLIPPGSLKVFSLGSPRK